MWSLKAQHSSSPFYYYWFPSRASQLVSQHSRRENTALLFIGSFIEFWDNEFIVSYKSSYFFLNKL